MIAYIGPQMGLPFATFGAALLALVVPFLLLLLAPFRALFRKIRKGGKPALAAVLLTAVAGSGAVSISSIVPPAATPPSA